MNEPMTELLRELASGLGVTAEYLWGALVRAERWQAAVYLLQVAALALWTWRGLLPLSRAWWPGDGDEVFGKRVCVALLAVFTGFVWLIAFFSALELVGLFDPEAAAARDLVHLLATRH